MENKENEVKRNPRGFYEVDGKLLPSVTTVIEGTLAKPQLRYWYGKVGNSEAAKISAESRSFGSAMHKFVAEYLRTGQEPLRDALATEVKQAWDVWRKWWMTVDTEFRIEGKEGEKIEEVIYNDDYAGTCDFFARGCLFDWKFGGGIYDGYKIQAGAYARLLGAFEARIVRVAKDGKNLEVLEMGKEALEEAAGVFDNLLAVFWYLRGGKKDAG